MENISRVVGRVQEIQARLNLPPAGSNGSFAQILDAAAPSESAAMSRDHHASVGAMPLGTVFGMNGPIPVAPATGSVTTGCSIRCFSTGSKTRTSRGG